MNLKKIKKTFELQHDQSDCGVACLKSLVKYYGGDISLERLRELSGTSKQGTTLLGLYQGAKQIGFEPTGCEADIKALNEHGKPVILHVLLENILQHFIVCYGTENDKFIIGDPAKGVVHYTKDALDKIWVSKTCLTLEPSKKLMQIENINSDKKNWLKSVIKEDYEILFVSIVVGAAISILSMVMAVFSQKLIDEILPAKDFQKLVLSIILVGLLMLIRAGFIAIRQLLLIKQSKQFNNRITHLFYNALLYLPKSFFDTRKIGELVARLNDTTRIQSVITKLASNYIIDALISITSIAFLFFYSWQTGIIAVLSMPIYFLTIYRFNKKIIASQKDVMSAYAQNESNYVSTMAGVSEIKNFNKQLFFADLNKLIYGHYQDKIFGLGKINIRLGFIAGITGVLFLCIILIYNSYIVYSDRMFIGGLIAILGIVSTLLPSVSNLALVAIPFNEAKVAFNRMYEFACIAPENSESVGLNDINFENLEITNLAFRFPGRKRILENINISLRKGEIISLIGESGSGKTTLVYLLQKFYTPDTGKVLINSSFSLEETDTSSWRNIIGVVSQDIHIFNGNVIDNICLGNSSQETEKVLKFITENGFSEYIDNLPQGHMTILGEEGINLSGGQKQIIVLARALYKNPKILILDEATAAMDRKTEQFTIELLQSLKQKKAIFYISHRIHILKEISERIYILENGKIQDSGSHQDLLKRENMYSSYWKDITNNATF